MAKTKSFKGLYLTNHALERARERGLKISDIWAVWHNPSGSRYASSKGAYIYWRLYGNLRVEVVAKEVDKRWVVISVWTKRQQEKRAPSLFSLILKKLRNSLSSF